VSWPLPPSLMMDPRMMIILDNQMDLDTFE
jgi:hypothetical protein